MIATAPKLMGALGGLAMLLATSGCMQAANNAASAVGLSDEPSTPEVAAFLDHDVEYALEATILEGAAIGAVVAGGACALLGGGLGECLIAGAVGGAVGGVAGAAVAEGNREQEVYKKEQNELAEQLAAERQGLNLRGEKLEAALASLRNEKRQTERQFKAGQITRDQYRAKAVALARDADRINAKNDEELAQLDKREAEISEVTMTKQNRSTFSQNATILVRQDRSGEEVQIEMGDFKKQTEASA